MKTIEEILNSEDFMKMHKKAIEDLKDLAAAGVTVMTCGTCLDFYGLKEKLQVGTVSNMYDIVEAQISSAKVIRP